MLIELDNGDTLLTKLEDEVTSLDRKELLHKAAEIISPSGERGKTYGDIKPNFENIAKLWSSYLDVPLESHQVADMMVLFKVARAKAGYKEDNYLDMAGYAAIANELQG